jgi:threonine/homoserine/homoserine lactone efflux protein
MTLSSFLAFCAVLLGMNVAPGPGMAAIVGTAVSRGARIGTVLLLGTILGDLVYFGAAVAGLGALVSAAGPWLTLFKLAAGLYLLWLGVKPWLGQASPTAPTAPEATRPAGDDRLSRAFFSGVMITLGNPNVVISFLAILPVAVALDRISLFDLSFMTFAVVLIALVIYMPLIAVAAVTRRNALGGARGAFAERIGALLVGAAGLWLVVSAGLDWVGPS